MLFPFHIPYYLPRPLQNAFLDTLSLLRITPQRQSRRQHDPQKNPEGPVDLPFWVPHKFPMNFLTAPLIADLFLLAISAIGRQEVHDGTVGAESIHPIDIMAFFITLSYIAISIDASGLIRYLAFKVLQWGGEVGHRLFFYLYAFFFVLGSFVGNDPIILSGTAFLAYMTRVSSNIVHPRAWIYTQFAVANIASAILVSSNPTNLVLAGAFSIRFVDYTVNMIVPVVITALVLFPFLLYILFADEALIPISIKMHELPEHLRTKKPVNPNIPHARGGAEEQEESGVNDEQTQLLSLEEIMNPFLDQKGAYFGAIIMAAALITILVLNATNGEDGEKPVWWVTVPAAFVMFIWEITWGWLNRKETREIARKGKQQLEEARARRRAEGEEQRRASVVQQNTGVMINPSPEPIVEGEKEAGAVADTVPVDQAPKPTTEGLLVPEQHEAVSPSGTSDRTSSRDLTRPDSACPPDSQRKGAVLDEKAHIAETGKAQEAQRPPKTLVSLSADAYTWCQETFPTVTAVIAHLPFALIPFAFTMFVLVQALVTKGWVPVFAHGWDHWVDKTGTIGAIGGMGFLSVILCNVSFVYVRR